VKIIAKVSPNSKVEEVIKQGDEFLIKVKEPPKEGKANSAIIKLLAEYFNVPRDSIRISSGFKSRNKVIEISGI